MGNEDKAIEEFLRGVDHIREIDKMATGRFLRVVDHIREIDKIATDRFLSIVNNYLDSVSQTVLRT